MGDISSKHSSNDDPQQKLQEKFQGKAERILGPSITEILKKAADQRAAHEHQATEKANTPEQGQNMLSKLTEGFVKGVENDGFFQKMGESMAIKTETKKKIADAMLPSKFLDLVEKHIQDMIKRPDIQCNPNKLSPKQKELITLYLIAAYYHDKGKRYQKSFKSFMSRDPEKLIAGLKDVTNQFRKNAEIQGLLGVTKGPETGLVTNIDLSKFEPRVADLSKLDLSNIRFCQFDATHVDTSDYKYTLAKKDTHERTRIENFLRTAVGVLLTSYEHKIHTEKPITYRKVLEEYIKIKTYESTGKSNLNVKDLDNLLKEYEANSIKLKETNDSVIKKAEDLKAKTAEALRAKDIKEMMDEKYKQWKNEIEQANPYATKPEAILVSPRKNQRFSSFSFGDLSNTLRSQGDRVAINTYSFQRELFSKEQEKRTLANAMALTHAYYELWQDQYQTNNRGQRRLVRKGLEQPASDDFQTNYALAKEIITANSEQMGTYSSDTIRDINTKLQEFANNLANDTPKKSDKDSTQKEIGEQDLNTFQLALRDEIETARTLNHWATNWEKDFNDKLKFDFTEDWVQESMLQLGIQQNHITESHQKLQNNPDAYTVISNTSGNSANNVAYDCPADKIVSTYKSLVEASARLKYIHRQLYNGFPVDSIPKVINGRELLYNDGKDMNCLLHSFLQLSTNWDENTIKDAGKEIKSIAIEKMSNKLKQLESFIPRDREQQIKALAQDETLAQDEAKSKEFKKLNDTWSPLIYERNTLREHIPAMQRGSMLQLGGFEGQYIIDCLTDQKLIDRKRGLLIYRYDKGRINCVESELMPRSPEANRPPYTLFLQQDVHFEAMIETDKAKQSTSRTN